MIVRNDPVTAIFAGVSAVTSIAGGFMGAAQAREKGEYESSYYNYMAEQEKVGLNRDLDAAKRERQATLARSRAVMAGQGGGVDTDYLAATEGLFGANEMNLIQDSQARQQALRTKAGYAQKSAGDAATASVFKGFSNAIPGGLSLYKEFDKGRGGQGGITGRQGAGNTSVS